MTRIIAIFWTLAFIMRLLTMFAGAPAPGWESYIIIYVALVMYAWRIDGGN